MVDMFADFSFEEKLWEKGFKFVAGADEVGRGCFAGPVVAGCVVFPKSVAMERVINVRIDDSKKLRTRQRERSAKWIKRNCLTWGIGEVNTVLINRIGMAKATKMAFRRAIAEAARRLGARIEFLLVDAFFVPYTKGLRRKNQLAITHGDEKVKSIGAASIIAKVYRDRLMTSLSKRPRYKKYGWGTNKGYGTRKHQEAIRKYGTTRYHRKVFIKTFLGNT
jgi:ribonuclease HII